MIFPGSLLKSRDSTSRHHPVSTSSGKGGKLAEKPEAIDPALEVNIKIGTYLVDRRSIISFNSVLDSPPSETLIVLLGQFTGCLWSGSLTGLDSCGGGGGLGTSVTTANLEILHI